MTRLLATLVFALVLLRGGCTPYLAWATCPPIKRSAAVVRHFRLTHVCPSTQGFTLTCKGYIVDHIVPRCLGGPDTVENMQYQTLAAARAKDRIEKQMCHVAPGHCAHQGD